MVPDVFLVGTARRQTFTPDHQTIIREAARASNDRMIMLWAVFETKVRGQAETMGVRFSRPDKAPFIARAAPTVKDFAADPAISGLLGKIAES